MTQDEAKKIIDVANDEGYSSATQGKYTNRYLKGLQILAKYTEDLDQEIAFEHDQMFAGGFVENMTPEDVREMGLHGWFISSEFDCWTHF